MASVNRALGLVVVGDQGPSHSARPQPQSVPLAPRAFLEPPHGLRRGIPVAGARRGLDQFDEAPAVEAEIFVFAGLAGGGEGLLISAETVVEHGARVPGEPSDRPSPLASPSAAAASISRCASTGSPRQAAQRQ